MRSPLESSSESGVAFGHDLFFGLRVKFGVWRRVSYYKKTDSFGGFLYNSFRFPFG